VIRVSSGGTWSVRIRRAAPYAASFLAVLILVLAGYLQGPRNDPRPNNVGDPGPPRPPAVTDTVTGTASRPSETGAEPAASSPTAQQPTLLGTTSAKTGGGLKIFNWIRDFGLEGGGDSDMETWVGLLSRGECAELLRSVDTPEGGSAPHTADVFRAAAQACLAAFHGKASLWTAADRAVADLARSYRGFDCVNRSVYDLTKALMRAHREHPDAVLRRGGRGDADSLDCPRLRSVAPPSGPAAGGYEAVLTGEHLPDPAVIHFGEELLTLRTKDGRTGVFVVPPMGQSAMVTVWIEGWPWGPTHSPTFDYERAPESPSDGP
jgi:hypothetical protein